MTNGKDRKFLTPKEAAVELRCHPKTVQRMLRSGRLKGFKLGGARGEWRIPVGSLRRLQEEEL